MLCWTNLYDIQASSLSHYVLLLIALSWGKFHKIILFSILFFMYRCTCCFKTRPSPRSSSQTQGQSVGLGERARRKISSTGERAPGYRLTKLFPKIQADAGSWLGTKNALYYCAPLANSFSWDPLVSSYTTAIVSITACLVHAPKKCRQSENYQFDIKSPSDFKILSARKLKTLFQKYKLKLTTGIQACIGHILRKY